MKNDNKDTIIDVLAEKIRMLENKVWELNAKQADVYYRKIRNSYGEKIIEALNVNNYEPNIGELVSTSSGIYLLTDFHRDEYTFKSCAWLMDYCADNEYNFGIEISPTLGIEFDKGEYIRPASNQEIILFDYMLREKGYLRTADGHLKQIKS